MTTTTYEPAPVTGTTPNLLAAILYNTPTRLETIVLETTPRPLIPRTPLTPLRPPKPIPKPLTATEYFLG